MNSHIIQRIRAFVALSGVLTIAGACGEFSGVEDGMGEVQVTLQEASAEALFQVVTAGLAAAPEASAGRVARENVNSLEVTVTGIGLLPYCEDAGEQNGDGQCEDLWETLDLADAEFTVDLLALPTEGEGAVPLAQGLIPLGEYHKVRLFISDAFVTFNVDVSVGRTTYSAYDAENPETIYAVEIPSGRTTGIKADIELEVTETNQAEVGLLFDSEATFRNVVATGNGRVLMPPVLKARGLHRHQNQNQNEG